jgi:hypothetical protein
MYSSGAPSLAFGSGTFQVLTFPDPAAGVEINAVVPGTAVALIQARFYLRTSAVAGDRWPEIRVYDMGGVVHHFSRSTVFEQANGNQLMLCSQGVTEAFHPSATWHRFCLPTGLKYLGGFSFVTHTDGLRAGDQYHDITLYVETFV